MPLNENVEFRLQPASVLRKLDAVEAGLGDATREPMRGAMVKCAVIGFADERERFLRFSSGGGDWAKLKPATVKAKNGDTRILWRTGALFASLTPGNSSNVIRVDRTGVSTAITVPYAKFHQRGTVRLTIRRVRDKYSPQPKQRMAEVISAAVRATVDQIWPGGGGGRTGGGGSSPGTNRQAA